MVYVLKVRMKADDSICAYVYDSLEESQRVVRKVKENIRGSEIENRWPNNYIITVNSVEVCAIDILSFDKKDVEIQLFKFVNGEWQETRRFSSREKAVNFVHRILDLNDYQANDNEDADGIWNFRNKAGAEVRYGVFVAIYKNIKKTVKTNKYFDILGVKQGATNEEIKKAYRQKTKIHHPDMGGDMQEFLKIQEAYENLINGVGVANKDISHRELSNCFICADFERIVNFECSRNITYKESNYSAGSDFLKGLLMFAVGGGLSLATFGAAYSRGGGTYTVYTGLIFYGLFRIFRSIIRGILGEKNIIKIKNLIHNIIIYGGIATIIILLLIGFVAVIYSIFK